MATAAQNGVVMACADRIGVERGVTFIGASIIVGADGWPVSGPASKDQEELLIADVDLDSVEQARHPHAAQPSAHRSAARRVSRIGRARRAGDRGARLSATIGATALLEGLNPPQREAVEAPDGPLLIFAGAGSGKTRVLTHRIAYVIATRRVRPDEICAVTFTNKAAREMRARVEQLIGDSIKGMWLGTFHALGARLLRRDGEAIGIPPGYTIYDEADRLCGASATPSALRGSTRNA